MASDQRWKCTVADLIASEGGSVKTGPFGTVLKADEYSTSGVPLISVREIVRGGFHVDSKTPRVGEATVRRLPEYVLQRNDIVFARKGSVERCAIVGEREVGWFLGSDGIRLRPPAAVDAQFLAYSFQSRSAADWLLQQATGSTMASLNQGILLRFPLSLPPLSTQRDISSVLGALDGRIDNLRQTNVTLEAIAQTLFKSWFVDFDPVRAKAEGREPEGMDAATAALFPSEFEDSEPSPIPKGWRCVRFGDVATQTKGSINPLASPEQVFQHYSLPAFDAGQLPVAEAGEAIKSNKTPVPSGAVLVSKLNPHIPRIWFVGEVDGNSVCSTEFLVWTPKSGIGSAFLYCLASANAFNSAMRQLVTGTSNSHQRVKPDQLANVQAAVVSEAVVLAFGAIAAPLLQQVERNRHRAATLAALRDTLLPRLISGKLRLPDVVEEAVTA
jgi:type I restriction enzyme, S subunit